ncbi:MAG TPA: hypothetical protein VH593_30745 [Ktedonobacteraceae bacterium]|jgi:hypothetical protein
MLTHKEWAEAQQDAMRRRWAARKVYEGIERLIDGLGFEIRVYHQPLPDWLIEARKKAAADLADAEANLAATNAVWDEVVEAEIAAMPPLPERLPAIYYRDLSA